MKISIKSVNKSKKRIYEEAEELIQENKEAEKPCVILGKENWHHGIIGIVSSKITEKYYKPSVLVCFEGEDARGSGRSIKGFDLHEALLNLKEYLVTAGGHSMAAGLSLKTNDFENFKKAFEEYAKDKITPEMLESEILIDEEIKKEDANISSINELSLLEPFGEGNSKPCILYKNLKIKSIRTLSEGKHIKMTLQDDNINIDAIGFNMGNLAEDYRIDDVIDVVGNIEINTFNNRDSVQINLKDIRKSINQ